jgi:phage tail sheath protein FI
MPDATLLGKDDFHEVCRQALAHCAKMADRFAILDAPPKSDMSKTDMDDSIGAFRNGLGSNRLMYAAAYYPYLTTTLNFHYEEDEVTISGLPAEPSDAAEDTSNLKTMAEIRAAKTALYNAIKSALATQRVVLPPSGAIAGVYAQVDRDRGVWKAPANVSLAGVIAPVTKITDEGQARLNIDATAGKSINVIRQFTGKGILVWGARTLAGNDNEWRYVNVRRLFNMIEESAKKSTAFAVFEPNHASTWLKVKGMIESYLYGLWEQGALAGATSEQAYFVNVGLGKTMRPDDVANGYMIVEIGIAAVRPSEFVILRFTHKTQEA